MISMMIPVIGVLFVSTPLAAAPDAACEAPITLSQWRLDLDQAEQAYLDLQLEAFRVATDLASADLGCLNEPLSEPDAARYHRLQGLRADLVKDPEHAAQAFLAARLLDPAYQLPEDLFPGEHPIRLVYGALPIDGLELRPLPEPARGTLLVNGAPGDSRTDGAPAVLQWQAPEGQVAWSAYLWPEDSKVGYPLAQDRRRAIGLGVVGAGVASAAFSGLSYGLARQSSSEYQQNPHSVPELDSLRARTNTWVILSTGSGVISAGALVGGILLIRG